MPPYLPDVYYTARCQHRHLSYTGARVCAFTHGVPEGDIVPLHLDTPVTSGYRAPSMTPKPCEYYAYAVVLWVMLLWGLQPFVYSLLLSLFTVSKP